MFAPASVVFVSAVPGIYAKLKAAASGDGDGWTFLPLYHANAPLYAIIFGRRKKRLSYQYHSISPHGGVYSYLDCPSPMPGACLAVRSIQSQAPPYRQLPPLSEPMPMDKENGEGPVEKSNGPLDSDNFCTPHQKARRVPLVGFCESELLRLRSAHHRPKSITKFWKKQSRLYMPPRST